MSKGTRLDQVDTPERKENAKDSEPKKPSRCRRKDLPKRSSVHNIRKPSLRSAVRLATSKKNVSPVVNQVEKGFYSNSSRAAKLSRHKTVENNYFGSPSSTSTTFTSLPETPGWHVEGSWL